MHLYRLMANVRAGAAQVPQCVLGQPGLVTVWVRAASEEEAFARAREVLEKRQYASQDDISVYMEQPGDPSDAGSGGSDARTEPVAGGYEGVKETALKETDGLFEMWFPVSTGEPPVTTG